MQKTFRIFLTYFFLFPLLAGAEEVWVDFAPEEVTLTGTIILAEYPSSPDFEKPREKEIKRHIVILLLDQPINIRGLQGDEILYESKTQVEKIELIFPSTNIPLSDFKGKWFGITGKLYSQEITSYQTEVFMRVRYLTREKQKHKPFRMH